MAEDQNRINEQWNALLWDNKQQEWREEREEQRREERLKILFINKARNQTRESRYVTT